MTRTEALRLAIHALEDQASYLADVNSRQGPPGPVDVAMDGVYPSWTDADRDATVEAIIERREALGILRAMVE